MTDIYTNRIEFIDITKGIGIFLVISSHVYGTFMSWALPFYIPVFFIVSGYCTTHEVRLHTKFKKLIIPYFIFSIVLMVVHNSFNIYNFIGILYSRWSVYPLNHDNNIFLLCSGNGPLWFLTSMFISYFFYWIIQRSDRPTLLIIFYILTTYLLSFLPILLPWSIDTGLLMAIFIHIGSSVRKKRILNKINLSWLICLTLLYIEFRNICGNINLSVRIYGRSLIILLPAAVVGSVLLMKVSSYLEGCFIGRIISMIGQHSLSIFCIHLPFITIWSKILEYLQIEIPPTLYGILCIIFIFSITYPISLFFDKYVFKMIR